MQTLDELRQRQKAILLDFKAREHKSEQILEKINEHEKEIVKLQRLLSSVLGIDKGSLKGKPRAQITAGPKKTVKTGQRGDGTSQKERVLNILLKAGKPLSIPEIIEALQNEGYVFQAKKPVSALTVLLYGNKTLFKKVKPGTFVAVQA